MTVLGTIFIFMGIAIIVEYFSRIIALYVRAKNEHTGSKGIKSLRFQKYNPTWERFVVPHLS